MRLTICELRNEPAELEEDWRRLAEHLRAFDSELLLLPEMPFSPWLAASPKAREAAWLEAVERHEVSRTRLRDLGVPVIHTAPVLDEGRRLNRAFATEAGESRPLHDKYYLPDEEGYWEASWYERGDGSFEPATVAGVTVGVQICTELWFLERSRAYGRRGVQLLVVPRATPRSTEERWLAAGRTAAVVAGAWCASSNLVEPPDRGPADLGGRGWLFDPEGEAVATTSAAVPFVTVDIDPAAAGAARATYPRYVEE